MSTLRAVRLPRYCLGSLVAVALTLGAGSAQAFCRTYTCQAKKTCTIEAGCPVGGKPLFWPGRCVSFSVHQLASPKRAIDLEAAESVLDQAYATWTDVSCPGGPPSIAFSRYPAVACDRIEFNECDKNANLWVFRDEEWPYDDGGGVLAQTWVHFDTKTGRIFDADVEVNTAQFEITAATDAQREQFIAIATHEAGHVLGLDHAVDMGATMYAYYSRYSSVSALTEDDVNGLCSIYPTEREAAECDPEPLNGFSSACGTKECPDPGCCATAPGRAPTAGGWAAFAGLVALLGSRLRRRAVSRVR